MLFVPRLPALKRIGPHSKDLYSLLTGSLLGNGYAERHGDGTRFQFHCSHQNVDSLVNLQKRLVELGYCSHKKPKVQHMIGYKGQIDYNVRFELTVLRA